jgi:hypothetical protein
MSSIQPGLSFGISSEYIEIAAKFFSKNEKILVYVEGFDDVSFWHSRFQERGLNVDVKAFCIDNKANGKGTIIDAIRRQHISLGKYLLVALDSDYDYILELEKDIFISDFVFQTYAYSIENLQWHPKRLSGICKTAANNTHHIDDEKLFNLLISWSRAVYPEFMRFLYQGAKDTNKLEQLISHLSIDNLNVDFSMLVYPSFNDLKFISFITSKGVTETNLYLFVRGHNFEVVAEGLCDIVISDVMSKLKNEMVKRHSEGYGQFMGEYSNSRCLPRILVKTGQIPCDLCIPKIINDIDYFRKTYSI